MSNAKHGLTDKEAAAYRAGKPCEICGEFAAVMAVDHDHVTGWVRGVLCRSCNTALGKFGDSPRLVANALAYLLKPQTNPDELKVKTLDLSR